MPQRRGQTGLRFRTGYNTLRPVAMRRKTAAQCLVEYDAVLRDFMQGVANVVGRWESPTPPRQLSPQEWLEAVHAALELLLATPRASGPGDEDVFREELGFRLTVAVAVMVQAKEARDGAWQSPKAVGAWHTTGNQTTHSHGARCTDTVPRLQRKTLQRGPRWRRARMPQPIVGALPRRSTSRPMPAKLTRSAKETAPMRFLSTLIRGAEEARLARLTEEIRVAEEMLRESRRSRP